MEVESAGAVTVPISETTDLDKICLELIEESKEKSPSKERSKTPTLANEYEPTREPMSAESVQQSSCRSNQTASSEGDKSQEEYVKSPSQNSRDNVASASESASKVTTEATTSRKPEASESKVPNEKDASVRNEAYLPQHVQQAEPTESDFKKLKERALSLDSELSYEAAGAPARPNVERRRSKIFETAERFNQMATPAESEKPKKIFIPGVNVGGAKRAFERKASLSSVTTPPAKASASKVIIDVPTERKTDKDERQPTTETREIAAAEEKPDKRDEEARKRAVDIITGAIGKPPVQKKLNGSPPVSPQSLDSKKLGLKIQLAPNDIRSATVSVSTPIETKFAFDAKPAAPEPSVSVRKFESTICSLSTTRTFDLHLVSSSSSYLFIYIFFFNR